MFSKGISIFSISILVFGAISLRAQTDDAVSRAKIEGRAFSSSAVEALRRAEANESNVLKTKAIIDEQVFKIQGSLKSLEKQYKEAGGGDTRVCISGFGVGCNVDAKRISALEPQLAKTRANLERTKKLQEEFKEKYISAIAATESAEKVKTDVEQNANKVVKTAELQLAENNRRIKKLEAFQKISDVDLKISGLGEKLIAIERVGDQAVIGAYVQKKMERLLNSEVLCSAAKACADSGKAKASNANISSEIFGAKSSSDFSNVKGSSSTSEKGAQ